MKGKLLRKIVTATIIAIALMPLTANAENGNNDWPEVFPTSDAEWIYRGEEYIGSGNGSIILYTLRGDTIVDGKTYNFIFLMDAKCIGLTRVEENKVFFRPEKYIGDNDEDRFKYEYLIYYFPEVSGEHIDTPNAPFFEDITSLEFNGKRAGGKFIVTGLEKREHDIVSVTYYDNNNNNLFAYDKWMKGIGGLKGFWEGRRSTAVIGPKIFYYLESFSYKGKVIYSVLNGVEQTDSNKNINVFNTNGKITIKGELTTPPYMFTLTNSCGKTVKEVQITNNNSAVSTNGMLQGIYIYWISGADISQTGKLIVK